MKKLIYIFVLVLAVGSVLGEEIVYSIPAQSGVSPSGTATYSIPLEVPAGTNGFQPNIGITYNSQSGMGNLGLGWDISGVSAITRGVKNIYYDGTQPRSTPEFNDNDQLYLDGQRLILLSGTHFQIGAVYGFEIENYSRISIKQDGSELYFELKTLEGQVFEYGKGNAKLQEFNVIFAWKLNKSKDVFDNEILYNYSNDGRVIKNISYCNNLNIIELVYIENNLNPQKRFINGFPVVQDSILYKISAKVNNVSTQIYTFYYDFSYNVCRLSNFESYSRNSSSLNFLGSTIIRWGESDEQMQILELDYPDNVFSVQDGSHLLSGDIDGDGYKDIIYAYSGDFSYNGTLRAYLKGAMSNDITFYTRKIEARMINTPVKFVMADIDNDGKDEIISVQYRNVYYYARASYDNYPPTLLINVYKYNEQTNQLYVHYTTSIPSDGLFQEQYSYENYNFNIFISNYDGDMYPDLYVEEYYNKGSNPNSLILRIFQGSESGNLLAQIKENLTTHSSNKGLHGQEIFGDFNSDGILDIVHPRPFELGSYFVYMGNGADIRESMAFDTENHYLFSTSSGRPAKFRNIFSIDANSDNHTDLLVQYNASNSNSWKLLQINNGQSYVSAFNVPFVLAYPHPNCTYCDFDHTLVIDYNGDGQQDVVIADAIYNSSCQWESTQWYFYKNNNGNFTLDKQFSTDKPLSKINPVAIDVNNDGIPDIAWVSYNYPSPSKIKVITFPNTGKKYLVTKITNNLGQTEEFTYKNNASYETPTGGDIRTLNVPLMLVDKHKQIGGETIEYQFTKAKMHKTKGLLGFEKVVATNITTGEKTESNYAVVNTQNYFNFALTSQKNYFGNQLVATSNFHNKDIVITGKRYIPVVDTLTSVDVFTNITKKKICNFDNFGRLISEKTLEGDYQSMTTYSNFASANQSLIPYLPQTKNLQFQKGSEFKEYLTNFTYTAKGQITSQTDFANKSENIITSYEYYPSGNLKKALKNVSGLPQSRIEYQYDSLFRFEIKKMTNFGYISQKNINFTTGRLLSETGIDGLTTSYTYNQAGQISSKTEPNGVVTTYQYNKDTAHGALYKLTETMQSINSEIITYYDRYDREVYKAQTGANGNILHSSKQYNTKNQLVKEISPHEITENTPAYKQYSYDNWNRMSQQTKFDGEFTNQLEYIYYNKTTTLIDLDDLTDLSSTTLDDAGLVASKTDRGGTITYTYNAEKQPVTISSNGIETQITYDQFGYQASLLDPSSMLVQYQNYPNGKVRKKISAKGDITVYQYDSIGRMICEIDTVVAANDVFKYQYFYNNSGYGIGQLDSEILFKNGDTVHQKMYTYNASHLLSQEKNVFEGTNYTFAYTYDNLWRQESKTSPSELTTTNIYDSFGNLVQIKANAGIVWQLDSLSAKAEIKQFTLGNNLTEKRAYLKNSLIQNQTVKYNTATFYAQNYDYDRHFNLILRKDVLTNRKENFTYDNLDRLTGIFDSLNNETYPITYANNGNIAYKYDAGSYVYHATARPYQLRDVHPDTNYEEGVTDKFEYLAYNYFNKTTSVSLTGTSYSLFYGVDNQRIKTTDSNYFGVTTRCYFGSYEKEVEPNGTVTHIDYIFAPSGLAAIVKTSVLEAVRRGLAVDDIVEISIPGANRHIFYYVTTDNLGSISLITNTNRGTVSRYYYQPFGGRILLEGSDITPRGYTFHEHLSNLGLINMNGRMYDPVLARFLSPDPYVQMPDFTQSFNRYAYCLNNPFKYTDPNGEFVWFVPVIMAGIYAIGNTVAHAVNGDIKNFWDGAKYFFQGAITGFAIGCIWQFTGPAYFGAQGAIMTTATTFGKIVTTAAQIVHYGMTASAILNTSVGFVSAAVTGFQGEQQNQNAAKLLLGNFYLDENDFFAGITQGVSRHTWEMFQTTIGHVYSQGRNMEGKVDRVDFLGGATFATRENVTYSDGVSLGNYVNINIHDKITGNFRDRVLSDPLYMHEYGHTIDSRAFGFSYLLAIGVPSLISAATITPLTVPPYNTHGRFWTERRANRLAKIYFGNHYGIDWSLYESLNPTY